MCTTGDQCMSGYCVDGVCCATACNGLCMACSHSNGAVTDGVCSPRTGIPEPGECDDENKCTTDTCQKGACDHLAIVLDCPTSNVCLEAACNPKTGTCGDPTARVCPESGLADCQTSVCDVTVDVKDAGSPCVTRSKLDGAPCPLDAGMGLCVAGSCFGGSGSQGSGSGGSTATTSSAASAGGATTSGEGGAGGDGAGGGDGKFHFVGGACSVGSDGAGDGAGRFAWLLGGLFLAARRPRRARSSSSSRRWSRDG